MGNRRKSRAKMVLPLRIWGNDTLGRQFVQLAHTLDVSASGIRVAGFRTAVRVGEIVSVQYRHHKANFRVAWVGERGTARQEQIGIEYLERDRRIFGLDMRDEGYTDDYEPPIQEAPPEYDKERAYMRHPVNGGAEVRTVQGRAGNWGSLVDLSLGGCYVQTTSPLPVNTRTRLLLKLGSEEIAMWGAVRTCHRDVGMGIEFTDAVSESDADRLKVLVKRLEAGEELAPAAVPKLNPDQLIERFKTALSELALVEDGLKQLNAPAEVLRHYRGSLGHLRTSAWASQRWFELEEFGLETSPVFSFLRNDRVQSTIQACQVLSAQFNSPGAKLEPQESSDLLRAVENLFAHLTGFSISGEQALACEAPGMPSAASSDSEPGANWDRVDGGDSALTMAVDASASAEPVPKVTSVEQPEPVVGTEGAVAAAAAAAAADSTNGIDREVEARKSASGRAPKKSAQKKREKRSRWKTV